MPLRSILKFNKFLYFLNLPFIIRSENGSLHIFYHFTSRGENLGFASIDKEDHEWAFYAMGQDVYCEHKFFQYPRATLRVIKILTGKQNGPQNYK